MRLSPAQTRVIVQCVRKQFGADARATLLGSRLDDIARGGDVDLRVESDAPTTLRQRALATFALENALEMPVDIVDLQRGAPGSAFARIARTRWRTRCEHHASLRSNHTGPNVTRHRRYSTKSRAAVVRLYHSRVQTLNATRCARPYN